MELTPPDASSYQLQVSRCAMSIIQSLKKTTAKEEKAQESQKAAKQFTDEERAAFAKVILRPRVTEKSSRYAAERTYVFDVRPHATKRMIKTTIEKMHNVGVVMVRTIRIPRKRRARGKLEGWKQGYKKALVKVKVGQTIET